MNKITQTLSIIAMLFLAMFTVGVSAQQQIDTFPITVKINGDELLPNIDIDGDGAPDFKTVYTRDSNLELKIQVLNANTTATYQDVEISAFLTGSKDKVSESTDPFDVQPGGVYTKTLNLKLPERIEDREYQLRIVVASPNSATQVYEYPLLIEASDNSVAIKEVDVSPNDKVLAGRALTANARLKNYGQEDEEDVKVVFSIPSLGLQETTYVNEIEKDESESTDDVLLRIPANAKTGSYDLEVTVYYNDGDDKVKSTTSVNVVSDEQAAQAVSGTPVTGNTVINVGVQSQTLARGENGVIYPLTVSNNANTARTYTFTVSGAQDWATTKVTPSNVVVLNAGETKQVYVYVAASENSAVGEHVFSVDVKEGNNVVQQIPLKADVLESAGSNLSGVKNALVVAVVLLVVLIVVLGGVVLYQRGKKPGNKEDEQIAQTYY